MGPAGVDCYEELGMEMDRRSEASALERKVARLSVAVVALTVLWVLTAAWAAFFRPTVGPVLSVERLEIREPDGSLAFAFASSAHPTAGTMDGKVLLADQVEERRFPHFIYFDGRGDEVGGLMLRTVGGPDGPSVSRFLTFDGYKHQETIVLGHNESPRGSVSGLRVIGHEPGATLLGGLADLGVEPGVTRAELQAAIEAIPPEARADRLRPLTGATRVELGTKIDRSAGLTLHDAEGRPRIVLETPATGAPSLRFLDEDGETVLRLPR
jgi:hypothetical protein